MGDKSNIEWTDATWNPTRGCSKVSAGCTNCYAMRQAIRQAGPGQAYEGLVHTVPGKGPQWTGRVRLVEETLELPLRWRAPRRVFVDSMSDLFHPDVPFWYVDRVWAVMALAPQHTFQILTKRPERADDYLSGLVHPLDGGGARRDAVQHQIERFITERPTAEDAGISAWPLPNVWIGTSVEDQAAADDRIPYLLRVPAAVRFLSCEPLLGPVDLSRWLVPPFPIYGMAGGTPMEARAQDAWIAKWGRKPALLHWVIAGGESGPGARPCRLDWFRSLRDQCRATETAFFLKQVGAQVNFQRSDTTVHLKDRKGGDMERWPEDLRVREFPTATT